MGEPRVGRGQRVDGRPAGAVGFDGTYWQETYSRPDAMDGIVNAEAHAASLKAAFDVVLQHVGSVADLGFGLGHQLKAFLHALTPRRAFALEPSPSAFSAVHASELAPEGTHLTLECVDLVTWCRRPDGPEVRADLGVCTSVLQYVEDDELDVIVPVLAERFRWMYLSVPTEDEFEQQERDEQFVDRWAIRRPKAEYVERFSPWFDAVGARILESRQRVRPHDSPFTDDLFRGWSR